MNPALADGLPSLRFDGLESARNAFGAELSTFLRDIGLRDRRFVHPIFGELSHEEWHRVHYKHIYHHLLQFSLIAPSPDAAAASS